MRCVRGRWDSGSLDRTVPTIAERHQLLLSHQKLAHKFAQKNRIRFSRVLAYEDLLQIAMVAIWKATETYETGHGASFTTYAFTALVNEFRNLHKHWKRPQREGTLAVLSLDSLGDDRDQAPWEPESGLPLPEASLEHRELHVLLSAAARRLGPLQRRVLRARFQEDRTLEEIGAREGVTREYIRQVEKKALGQLRQSLKMGIPELRGGPQISSKARAEPLATRTLRKLARSRALT